MLECRLREPIVDVAETQVHQTQLHLIEIEGMFAVSKLPSGSSIPEWATANEFFSITRTSDELSIVCRQEQVPTVVHSERGWRCFRVAGSMPFTTIGVVSSLTTPLAASGISVFVISTFDTDYLLVKSEDTEHAVASLRFAGHEVNRTSGVTSI